MIDDPYFKPPGPRGPLFTDAQVRTVAYAVAFVAFVAASAVVCVLRPELAYSAGGFFAFVFCVSAIAHMAG